VRLRLLLVAAAFVLVGCGTGAGDYPATPVVPVTAEPVSAAPVVPVVGPPVLVTIPKLRASDDIIPVELDDAGGLELPPVSETGWYSRGVKPGQTGSALLASHVNYNKVPGALGRIGELKSGDLIVVKDSTGIERVFGVYDVQTIAKTKYDTVTLPLVFAPRTTIDLVLVTCGGKLVGVEYDSNVVVSARLAA